MKEIKFNDLYGMIKSGIVGALVLIDFCIILLVINFAIEVPYVSSFYSKAFAAYSLGELLVTIVGIGFIFGLTVRRKFSIVKKTNALMVVTAIPLIIGVLCIYVVGRNINVPQSTKLAECTNNVLKFNFRIPKGFSYKFVLATPGVGMMLKPPFLFSGHIQMTDGTTNVDFLINSEIARQSNWLKGNDVPWSLLLTDPWNTNSVNLNGLIRSQKNYDVKIVFDRPPPPSTSIWFCWVQAVKDKNK